MHSKILDKVNKIFFFQVIGTISGKALVIVVALAVVSGLLLVTCLLCGLLLSSERRKNRQADVAKNRSNGWLKNGTATLQHSQKNGTCIKINGNVVTAAGSTHSLVKSNGYE